VSAVSEVECSRSKQLEMKTAGNRDSVWISVNEIVKYVA
jgi:hypothetical protein